jgi:uridine kinase
MQDQPGQQLLLPQRPLILGIAGCSGSGKTTLAEGRTIERPIYDFATHTRVPNRTETITPTQVLIVEGILALHYESLRNLYDFSIYVNAPNQICLNRRIYRDMRERGRTEESVRAQFEATAKPMADLYVLPSAAHASITVEGTEALDWSIEQVLQRLHQLDLARHLHA